MGSMDDTWRTFFNEHTRAPIYTVSHYISYLRRFVADTGATGSGSGSSGGKKGGDKRRREAPVEKKSSASDGIDPLSYFLRKLKLDLKVSYDSFVQDFVRVENEGLKLLLKLLSNLQSPSPGAVTKSSASLNISTSRLDGYKKAVTDEHDCLLCIKFCLRVQSGVSQLVQDADGLQRMSTGVQGASSKARITCLEILTLCLQLNRQGVESVVEAFTIQRLHTGQSVRFKMLVSMLHTKSPSQVLFQVTCLKFFNTLLNACSSANQRVYLQQELLTAGLDLHFLTQVDALLKRLRESYRDPIGGVFSGQEGPLQVSSRVGSLHGGHGVTYFQPEELAGTVQLAQVTQCLPKDPAYNGAYIGRAGTEYRRGLSGTNGHCDSDGSVVPAWQPNIVPTTHSFYDNVDASGPEADDSDSDFISVSAQQTPRFQRKYLTRSHSSSQPRNRTVQQPLSTSSDSNTHREYAHSDSPNPPPYDRHDFSNGVNDGQRESNVPQRRYSRESTMSQRRYSVESIMDAYGLVIHARDRRRENEGPQDPQDAYSNFKLRYFSSPNFPQRHEDVNDSARGHRNEQDMLNGSGTKPEYENGMLHESEDVIWKSYYPFSKRALYRGLEKDSDRSSTTFPVRAIHTPPTLDTKHSDTVKTDQTLITPDPDYTPLPTPRGSTRSLNAEVARVLHDFENTLRAHEPSQLPSIADVSPVAFV